MVVRRGDNHGVQPVVFEQLAVIGVLFRLAAISELVQCGLEGAEAELGDIGDGDEPMAELEGLGGNGPAAVAAADETDVEPLIGAEGIDGRRTQGECGRSEKSTTRRHGRLRKNGLKRWYSR